MIKPSLRFTSLSTLVAAQFLLLSAVVGGTYEKDVLPILEKHCSKCHNQEKMKAGVSIEVADMKSDVGRIIIPGDPRESMLYEVLVRDKDRMPPKTVLSNKEIAAIRDWIKDGASFGGEAESKKTKDVATRRPLRGKWANKKGKVIEADLLRIVDDKAILQTRNGKIYKYPLDQLSEESAHKAREHMAK